MDLQQKTLLVFVLLLGIMLVALSMFISGITLTNYRALEQEYMYHDIDRAENVLENDVESVSLAVSDWAPWDELYDFAGGNNTEFEKINLVPSTYMDLSIHFVVITNRRGDVVYAGYYDHGTGTVSAPPPPVVADIVKGIPPMGGSGDVTQGILLLPRYPVVVSARPIVHSDYSGEPAGLIIMGREIDPAEEAKLGSLASLNLSIVRLDDPGLSSGVTDIIRVLHESGGQVISPLDNDYIGGYVISRDLSGNDALLLSVVEPRDIYHQGLATSRQFIFVILGCGAALGLIVILLLNKAVLSRVEDLSLQVNMIGKTGDFSRRIEMSGDDEFHELSSEINSMLTNIEDAHRHITASEIRFREMANLLPQIIFEIDNSRNLSYVNQYGLDLFGVSEAELKLGIRVDEYMVPEDLPRMMANLEKRVHGEKSQGEIYSLVTKGNVILRVLIYTSPIIRDGRLEGFRGSGIDITKRLELEEALEENREYLKTLFQSVQAGIIVVDANTHTVIDANDAAAAIIGIPAEKLIGVSCHRFVCPPDDKPCPITDLHQTVDNAERILVMADGREVPIIKYVIPILLHGRPCLLETFIDNSERKKMQDAIQASQERFENIIRASPVGVLETDPDGVVTFASKRVEEMIGFPVEVLLKTHWSSKVTEQDREALANEIRRQSREIGITGGEAKIERPDGSVIWVYGQSVTIYNPDGTIKGHVGTITDISARKAAEDALVKSEEKYRQLAENIADLMFSLDKNGIFTYISPIAQRYGFYVADVVGKPIDVFIHEEDRERITSDFKTRMREGEAVNSISTFRILDKMGRIVWIEESSTIKFDEMGAPIGLYVILRDVTERVMAEEALRESREILDGILHASPVGIFRAAADGTVVYVNDTWHDMTGFTPSNVLGKRFIQLLDPADIVRNSAIAEKAILEGEGVDGETGMVHANGSVFWVYMKAVPIKDSHGDLSGWVGACVDISARKAAEEALAESEEKYRAITENTADILFSTDLEGNLTYVSPQVRQYGYRVTDIAGRPLNEIFHPDDRFMLDELLRTELREHQQSSGTLRVLDTMDSLHWVEVKSSVKMDQNGRPAGLYGILRDVTERKRAADAVALANKKLNLMNNITRHDILNTVTGLFGLVDMAASEESPEERADLLREIKNLGKIIQRQIAFTREYQEVGVKLPRWHNMASLVGQIWNNFSHLDIRCSVDLDDIEVFADPLLEKVIHNLVDNAVRYGEHVTQIRFRYQVSDTGLRIFCEDNGVGIPENQKKYIFDRGVGKHTGLGLFLSREILGITGISIEENGIPGTGARFEILVPRGTFRLGGRISRGS